MSEIAQPAMHTMGAPVSVRAALNPAAMFKGLWERRTLIGQFTRREVLAKNQGSSLGMLWTVLHPLLMLGVYTFVFAIVWQARWGGAEESRGYFATNVFCGLIVWEVFSGAVGAAPSLIVSNANLVKKVIFPLEILPVAGILAGLTFGAISFVILLAANLIFNRAFSTTLYLFPLVLVPLVCLTAGVSWLAASLGVFLRDLRQLVAGVMLPVLFFMTPIFYPPDRVPEAFRWVVLANPIAPIIDNARRTALFSRQPDWPGLGMVTVLSVGVMVLGYAFFVKSKRSFADVL